MFSAMLRKVGLLPERSIPGEGVAFRIFDVVGETVPSMLVTRQMARAAAGWDRRLVQKAGEQAADLLIDEVPPMAKALIARHHEEGRKVVMATTSPYDLVRPLAEALDLDDVVATRYVEDGGRYTGGIDGFFVWGPGKLAAVRAWASERRIDVAASYAYSDSIYDLPLLQAVRFPHAVNPDPRLRVVAALRRWPSLSFHDRVGAPKVVGIDPQRMLHLLARPQFLPWVRFDVADVERVPRSGPAILVGNHRSYFDPLAIGWLLAKAGRPVRFLGKKEVFDAPVVGQVVTALGGIRVERGTGSDEPLQAAAAALEAGEAVALMPQGTIPRGHAFFDPELKGRWGAARLAAMTGAPVIPIGLWGTERVWPRNSRTPDVLALGHPPTVRIRVGEPVELGYEDPDADTRAIMAAIVDLLPPEAKLQREPTAEELARTLPAGYRGDPDAETDRRPGRD
jgi:putative phosphoserine phosphatase/1-acylglycerol-3-phosphate O-acyltransferase